MSEFRFADPFWAHALWGVLAGVVVLAWFERRGAGALDRLIGVALQARLVQAPSLRSRHLRIALLGLSLAFLVVALMRPQFGLRQVAESRAGASVMVAIDVSRSMLAEDVAPSRLERAKAEIVDLLAYLEGDQVGLIAFAGRATVLAPLTPDFGFLRLVLEGVGPHSVTRGGTRLEEPIRKAVAGFGPRGDAARALLLITDGEDHGSFPLDAAAEAAEAGVVIVAIGFGDEEGSEIVVTEPVSGARQPLRDGDGRPVRSRLDGELLRDLALATGGAYVPAGTGVLDLESIYREHIEGLVAGELELRGRTVRDEGYQWAVLLGLVCLLASVAVSGRVSGARRLSVVFLALALALPAAPGEAQEPATEALEPELDAAPPEAAESEAREPEAPEPEDPREIYNIGVIALGDNDPDDAHLRFERARREAGADGELRFRASYNLGLATAQRAARKEGERPQEALQDLHTAADWFRDAISQRPDDESARVNLEVALRRALLLSDRLAKADDEGVDGALRKLAEGQRMLVADLVGLVQQAAADPEAQAGERGRRAFRTRATAQRALLSDGDQLAGRIEAERQSIETTPDTERSPEDRIRSAQLEGTLHYLHRAREKMGQARRQLRQRQSERAFRRASDALTELKRAIDQWLDPVQLLDALVAEGSRIATATATAGAVRSQLADTSSATPTPVSLDSETLHDEQRSLTERTGELDLRLLAGLEADSAESPETAELLEAVGAAQPLVAAAREHFDAAGVALEADDPGEALPRQADGIVALSDAREHFLDLKGLIEATYADERRIESVLQALEDPEGPEAAPRDEYVAGLRELQARNVVRGERLEALIEKEKNQPPAPAADGSEPDPETLAIQAERLDLAGQLLTLALGGMDAARLSFAGDPVDWQGAGRAVGEAVRHLEALRRLFLSITEQLKDVIRVQVDLADATQEARGLAESDPEAAVRRIAPALAEQRVLAGRSGDIAGALEAQSNESGGVLDEEADGAETSRRLRVAAEHVVVAQSEMESAVARLEAEPAELAPGGEHQVVAIRELEEALAQLVPPEERDPQDGQDESGQGEDQQPQPGEQDEQDQEPGADPAQLLQAVRDREAERRRQGEQRSQAGYETVERDW